MKEIHYDLKPNDFTFGAQLNEELRSCYENFAELDLAKQNTSEKGVAGGYAPLGEDAKIPIEFIPAIDMDDTIVANSEAEMLNSGAAKGTTCVRTDQSKTYILGEEPATELSHWIEMLFSQTVFTVPYVSAGIYVKPTISDNNDGTLTLGEGEFLVYSDDEFSAPILKFVVPGADYTFTDNTTNYIVFDYSTNVPLIISTTNRDLINQSRVIPIVTVYREGIELHILDWDTLGRGLANKITDRLVRTERFTPEIGGLIIGTAPTRLITVTSGKVWYGAANLALDAVNSSTDICELWYSVNGVWAKTSITQYNNTQYNAVAGLTTLSAPSRYAVNWVFRGAENAKHLFVVLGTGDYKDSEASASTIPMLPSIISSQAILVGRIIVQKSLGTPYQLSSAFDVPFNRTPVTDHNMLSNLQGGAANEYYHLSSAQLADLVSKSVIQTITAAKTFNTLTLNAPDISAVGDFTIKTGPEKIVVYEQPTYRDEYPVALLPAGGAAAPDEVDHTIGGVQRRVRGFDGNATEERLSGSFEISHDYMVNAYAVAGRGIEAHLHWRPSTTGTGTVTWYLDWEYSPPNAAPIPQATIQVTATIDSNKQYWHLLHSFGILLQPSTPFSLGGKIGFNLRRTPTTDSYAGDALLEQCALHIPCDKNGSRKIYEA